MRLILSLLLILFMHGLVWSQHRLAVYSVRANVEDAKIVNDASRYIVNAYGSDDRFVVIDRSSTQLIKKEQERQKSEEFIDGYIVDQGRQEGFDYLLEPSYTDKILSVRIHDIAKGTVISTQKVKLKKNLLGIPKDFDRAMKNLVDKINADCFEIRYEVLRSIEEKKGKVKKLLFVMGYNQNAKVDDKFDLYCLVTEKIGELELERKEIIGEAEIEEVQDGNFSVLKVKSGGEELYSRLKSSTKVYGSPRLKK